MKNDPKVSSFFKTLQEAGVDRRGAFEERVVRRILKDSGLVVNFAEAKRGLVDRGEADTLTLSWFNEHYPEFPMTLVAQKIPYTHRATLADLYGRKRFQALPWWKEYQEQAAQTGVDIVTDKLALVFNLPHAQDAFLMVLHNQPSVSVSIAAEQREDPYPRTIFPIGKTGVTAVLESFPGFMMTVGDSWKG